MGANGVEGIDLGATEETQWRKSSEAFDEEVA